MIIKKRIDITMTEEEYELIKWLAKQDNSTIQQELKMIFSVEIEHLKELYLDEMKLDIGGN